MRISKHDLNLSNPRWSSALRVKSGVNFINVFTSSFYTRRSQKHKKTVNSSIFLCFWVLWAKKLHVNMLMKLTPGGKIPKGANLHPPYPTRSPKPSSLKKTNTWATWLFDLKTLKLNLYKCNKEPLWCFAAVTSQLEIIEIFPTWK